MSWAFCSGNSVMAQHSSSSMILRRSRLVDAWVYRWRVVLKSTMAMNRRDLLGRAGTAARDITILARHPTGLRAPDGLARPSIAPLLTGIQANSDGG